MKKRRSEERRNISGGEMGIRHCASRNNPLRYARDKRARGHVWPSRGSNPRLYISYNRNIAVAFYQPGGEMGIRTPDTLLGYTRFPIVLLRPARTSLHDTRVFSCQFLAEGQGFEPWSPFNMVKRFSRPPHSTALPPFRIRFIWQA